MNSSNAARQSPCDAASRARWTTASTASLIARPHVAGRTASGRNRRNYRRNGLAHASGLRTTTPPPNEEDRMQSVNVNGAELEYEVIGAGEPVLLISPVIADGFLPLLAEPALADRYQLIRYHKRGWVGSTHTPPPVSVADHAADAAALLDHLGLRPVHVAGHSSGAAVAAQLALDHPEYVHTLMLLEPSLISVPSLEAFFTRVQPALEAYASGDHAGALAIFMSAVSGLEWTRGKALLEERIPGAVAQAIRDADTFFGVELPALTEWTFGADHAARLNQ